MCELYYTHVIVYMETVLFQSLWPHQCSTDSEATVTATNAFITTPVASCLWAKTSSKKKKHRAMPEC